MTSDDFFPLDQLLCIYEICTQVRHKQLSTRRLNALCSNCVNKSNCVNVLLEGIQQQTLLAKIIRKIDIASLIEQSITNIAVTALLWFFLWFQVAKAPEDHPSSNFYVLQWWISVAAMGCHCQLRAFLQCNHLLLQFKEDSSCVLRIHLTARTIITRLHIDVKKLQ